MIGGNLVGEFLMDDKVIIVEDPCFLAYKVSQGIQA